MRQLIRTYTITGQHEITITGYTFTKEDVRLVIDESIAITDKRIMIGRKRLLFGYFFLAITPEMFNDIKVKKSLIWAKVEIDTIKEFIVLSNLQGGAASEIETNITRYVMKKKKKPMVHGH